MSFLSENVLEQTALGWFESLIGSSLTSSQSLRTAETDGVENQGVEHPSAGVFLLHVILQKLPCLTFPLGRIIHVRRKRDEPGRVL